MDAQLRQEFLARYSDEGYQRIVNSLNSQYANSLQFRICESPIFLPQEWVDEALKACASIIEQIRRPEFAKHALTAIPPGFEIPGEDDHPQFIQIDFAVTESGIPQLIELQGFASMFCYQAALDRAIRREGFVPDGCTCYFSELEEKSYLDALNEIIVGEEKKENVVLLEINPEQQRTRIDFHCTKEMIGIETVDLADVKKSGRNLYYERDGRKIDIHRIYNRVILDELVQKNLKLEFDPRDDVEVSWAAHPNWFLKLSKHTLPYLEGPWIPESRLVIDLKAIPEDLENYVLKPLYSFAGAGVKIDVSREDVERVEHPDQVLLMKKVPYWAFLDTPFGYSKAEIRVMILWDKEPIPVLTLVRVSRGSMSSVSQNSAEGWIGATIGYLRSSSSAGWTSSD